MEVVRLDLNNIYSFEPLSACIGYFDGMHLGHIQLVNETLKHANTSNLKSACITFEPDPWCVIKNIQNISHITSMDERIEIGRKHGLDYWIIIPFTLELSKQSPKEFENLLKSLNIKKLICGFDYSYGHKGQGNIHTLRQQNDFEVFEVNEVSFKDEKISSTRIEREIMNGNMILVSELLGRHYSIKGHVIKGSHLGNTIGFPTANISCTYNPIIPSTGVYIGYILVDDNQYKCMMNIGHNPTFNYQQKLSIETYILDFDQDIYGKDVECFFYEKIRDEKKFNSIEELKEQLNIDRLKAQQL